MNRLSVFVTVCILIWTATGCRTVDFFEKNVAIPNHQWERSFKPEVVFEISDTVSYYNLFVSLRHNYAYEYNNIWLNIGFEAPGDTATFQKIEVQLATNENGWLGTGMDDIYEMRKPLNEKPVLFRQAGTYKFTLEQIMRDNPLPNIMNAGMRVEKVVQ